ncbi:MAG TPA: hypothetical protein VIG62_20420 [Blastocatellia bacterium]|jgi:hypothetical protein
MLKRIHKPSLRAGMILFLLASMLSQAAPAAFGQEENKQSSPREENARTEERSSAEQITISTTDAPRQLDISSTLSRDTLALTHAAESTPRPFAALATMPAAAAVPRPAAAAAASTAPMTNGEKFSYFFRGRFLSIGAYARPIFTGMFNELLDNNEGKKDTVGDFFADSMTRAARSFGNSAANGFFEKFFYPVIFNQDPRYHRSDKRGAGAKIKYAVSRIFVTQGDNCGCDQFNISYLAGGLTGAAVSNYWQRDDRRGVGRVFRRWGTHIGFTAVGYIIREFLGGQ